MQQLLRSRNPGAVGALVPDVPQREPCCVGLVGGEPPSPSAGVPITVLPGLCVGWLREKGKGRGWEHTPLEGMDLRRHRNHDSKQIYPEQGALTLVGLCSSEMRDVCPSARGGNECPPRGNAGGRG